MFELESSRWVLYDFLLLLLLFPFSVQKLCKNRPALQGKVIVEQQNSQLMLSDTTGLRVNRQHIITKLLMKGIGLYEALIRHKQIGWRPCCITNSPYKCAG